MEYPCVCTAPRRSVYSNALSEQVCLLPTACTDNWHCTWPQTCSTPAGQSIGSCVNSKRRDLLALPQCPYGSQLVENEFGQPKCVPEGSCISHQSECVNQEYNSVKCLATSTTNFAFKSCVCNYGFTGGLNLPCKCVAPKRSLFSPTLSEQLCLSLTECTENWHCATGQKCSMEGGQRIGVCSL